CVARGGKISNCGDPGKSRRCLSVAISDAQFDKSAIIATPKLIGNITIDQGPREFRLLLRRLIEYLKPSRPTVKDTCLAKRPPLLMSIIDSTSTSNKYRIISFAILLVLVTTIVW